jgi:tetratricopeptide (TPR) repeat protein
VRIELSARLGNRLDQRLEARLADAVRAYERDRYRDALRLLATVERRAPGVPAVMELAGLALYRLGRWRQALRRLEAFGRLTGSVDQLPVVADCYRALGRSNEVERVWCELRQASPGVEVLSEGRLVVAGARADRGDLGGAIAMLEAAAGPVRHPRPHHLRQWYALADLYERAGELPKARKQFARVLSHSAEAFDAPIRLAALG